MSEAGAGTETPRADSIFLTLPVGAWSLARRHRFAVILIALTLAMRLLWAAIIPIWQTPDETAHYGYVQSLGEHATLRPAEDLSREIRAVDALTGLGAVPFHPNLTQIFAADSLDGPNETAVKELPGDVGAQQDKGRSNPAAQYPPTYYAMASLVYRATASFDVFTVMFSLRALSALISTATVFIGYLTARRFFKDEGLARAASLIITVSPMYAYAGMAVNPDVLAWLLFASFLYLVTYSLDEGLSPRTNLWLILTLVLGLLVKQTFLIGVPMYLVFLGIMCLKKSLTIREASKYAAMMLAAIAVLDGWLYVSGIIRTSADYEGGVHQSRSVSGFIDHVVQRRGEYYKTSDTFWGSFGWLDTPLSKWIYDLIRFGTAFAVVGAAFHLLYSMARCQPDWKALCYASLGVTYAAAWVVLNYIRVTSGEPWLLQGRYFFPIIVPTIVLLMRGLLWYVPTARLRDVVLVALVIGMVCLNTDAIFRYVIPRYYL